MTTQLEHGEFLYDIGKYEEAFPVLLQSAHEGSVSAQRRVGVMYYKGQGVAQDYAQAMVWLLKAAEQGDAKAQFTLGRRYAKGRGVPKDDRKAVEWYQKAVGQDG